MCVSAQAKERKERRDAEGKEQSKRPSKTADEGEAPVEVFDNRPQIADDDDENKNLVAQANTPAKQMTPAGSKPVDKDAKDQGGDVKLMFTSEPTAYAQPPPEAKSQRAGRGTHCSEQDEDDQPLPGQCGMGPSSSVATSVVQV